MMAKAVAGEIDATFFAVRCSNLMSKWVGEAERNVAELFTSARSCSRAVVFLDEAEALLPRRGGDSPVMNRLVPEFLSQVDGLAGGESMLLLGATNRPWDMDEAALRQGRFGDLIYVGLPDLEARQEILRKALDGVPVSPAVSVKELAVSLEGFSGADLVGIAQRLKDRPFEREIVTGRQSQIEAGDVEAVLSASRPSVTGAMLARYRAFRHLR
jgi:transitional endoplasmic reticulum ATPase